MIPPEELKELAELYDKFAHALDPFSEDRDQAEEAFHRKLEHLRCTHAPGIPSRDFRREAVRQCKNFLRKN